MTASAKITLDVKASLAGAPDLGSAIHTFNEALGKAFGDGNGADQINQVFSDIRTLALSTSEDLDLAGGLTNALGQLVTFTKIKGIIIASDAGNGDNLEVGGAAANAFASWVGDATDQIIIRPGGVFCLLATDATAYAVTAGTGDLLTINNLDSAASADYTIILLGVE